MYQLSSQIKLNHMTEAQKVQTFPEILFRDGGGGEAEWGDHSFAWVDYTPITARRRVER